MTPLPRPARALIEAARSAEQPTLADKRRVRARLAAHLAGAAAAAAASATANAAASAGASGAASAAGEGASVVALNTGSSAATTLAASGTVKGTVGAAAWAGVAKAALLGALSGVCLIGGMEVLAPALAPVQEKAQSTEQAVNTASHRPNSESVPAPVQSAVPAQDQGASARPAPAAVRPEARPSGSALRDEVELLKQAQQAMAAGDNKRAVELLDSHAERFKSGALKGERLAARAIALCQAGRDEEARRAFAEFRSEAPGSPLEGRVRSACSGLFSK